MSRFSDKLEKAAAVQDESLGQLTDLQSQGYTTCVWQASWAPCNKCRTMNGQSFPIAAFVSGLTFSAPVFERSHVGCRCTILVQNPTTGDEVEVLAAF